MKVAKILKLLPLMLVACMLLSTVSAFAAVTADDVTAATEKVTVVVSGMAQNEEIAIMVYDQNTAYTDPSKVPAADILYIDQKAATVADATGGTYSATFEFYLKDGATNNAKTVAIGSASASAVTYETFEVKPAATYTTGDLDGEDGVDDWDAVLLLQYLAGGYDVTIIEEAADIDGEDGIDDWDAVLLLQYLAGGYPSADAYFE